MKTNCLTLRSVSQFWIFGHFNFPTPHSDILRGPTLHSAILRRVMFFVNIFSETILNCLSGTKMGSIHKKYKKSGDKVLRPKDCRLSQTTK